MRHPLSICSPLCTPEQVRACCSCLIPDYDLTDDIWRASELFYRLSGRVPSLKGSCLEVVRPCAPSEGCGCDTCCGGCTCELDYVRLPNVYLVEQVTINGLVVDPRSYAIEGADKLVLTCGGKWPQCQDLGADASPINQFEAFDSGIVLCKVRAVRNRSCGWDLGLPEDTFIDLSVFDPLTDVLEFVGSNGRWLIPVASLKTNGSSLVFTASTTDGPFDDVFRAAEGRTVQALALGPLQPSNTPVCLDDVRVMVRKYYARKFCGGSSTFEIVYRSGSANVPIDISLAVAKLACEFALASCGSDQCRLPSKFRSFRVDGDMTSAIDPYLYITAGLTGIEEVDSVIRSINPRGLYRRGRLLSAEPAGRSLKRFRNAR
jgi:hypothetical protein